MATGPVEERGDEFDFIVCDLCDDPLDDPCVLPCWHVFCLPCLVAYSNHRHHVNIIICPSCQQTFSLPEDGLDGLKSTSYDFLKRIAEGSSSIRAQEENGYLRHYCRDREFDIPTPDRLTAPVNRRCEECEELLCHRCTSHHLRERHTGNDSSTCHFHGLSREVFCETCDAEICRACVSDVHRRHDVTDLATLAQSRREALAKATERATRLDPERTAEEYIETIRQMIREQAERQLHDVAMQVARRRRLLEDQVGKMASEIRRDIEAEKAAYMSAHGGFGTSRRDTLALFEHLIECGTEREIVELYPEMIRYLAEVLPEPTPTESPVNSQRTVVFTPANDPDLSSHDFIGSLDGAWVRGHRSGFSAAAPTSTPAEEASLTPSAVTTTPKEHDVKSHHRWKETVTKLKTRKGVKIPATDAHRHGEPTDKPRRNGKEKEKLWSSFVNKVKHNPRSAPSEQETPIVQVPMEYKRTERKLSVDETAKQASQNDNDKKKRRKSIFSILREDGETKETLASKGKKSPDVGHHSDVTNPHKSTATIHNDSERQKSKNKTSQLSANTLKDKELSDKKSRRMSVSEKYLGLMSEDKKGEIEKFKRDREATRTRLRNMWAEEDGVNETIAEVHAGNSEEENGPSDPDESARSDWLKRRAPQVHVEGQIQNGDDRNSTTQQNGNEPVETSSPDQHEVVTLADRIKSALNFSFLGLNNSEEISSENREDDKTADDVLAPREAQSDRHGNGRSMDDKTTDDFLAPSEDHGDHHGNGRHHARRKTSIASILSTSSNLSHVTTSSLTSSDPEDGSKSKSHMKKFKAILQRKRKTQGQRAGALRRDPSVVAEERSDSDWTTDDTEGRKEPNRSLGKKMKKLLKKK
ncbi:PREDICTED: biorientation of chromosomes in cell division protein 1-like 1 [Branchiostoma belcheri]|uniref:Biorientation of chromosomes in cell division protein 1-like 1 n=1 Tax=Branchiostoma belcheri TaxID=7741 RepID=A0A6P5AI56_BRABE|nr:PREDICTED: biorientation of chromosomes in cell division protein 1-like 1 [Branchiostoma belcheri]XP_019645975.1 PREDICTED: biorientation of chromosomes in cell division protein 1-like 1 [Branchiostoma belcheri]